MRNLWTVLFMIFAQMSFGQNERYVNAENGLILRQEPSKSGQRIGKLDYGTLVYVTEETTFELTVKDGDKVISGKWVKVEDYNTNRRGYVFDGYLTTEELSKRTQIKFKDFSLKMDFDAYSDLKNLNALVLDDTVKFYMDLGETPEDKKLWIKQSSFEKVNIFQQHENSITIMNEGAHCDLMEWEHYYSDWTEMPFDKQTDAFNSISYPSEAWGYFIEVDMDTLKAAVKQYCGDYEAERLGEVKSVQEYPCGVSMSRIFYKIVLTRKDGSSVEKIIEFEIPMGC